MMRGYYQEGGYSQYPVHYGWGFPDLTQLFFMLLWVVLFIDAVLLGLWFWKHLKK